MIRSTIRVMPDEEFGLLNRINLVRCGRPSRPSLGQGIDGGRHSPAAVVRAPAAARDRSSICARRRTRRLRLHPSHIRGISEAPRRRCRARGHRIHSVKSTRRFPCCPCSARLAGCRHVSGRGARAALRAGYSERVVSAEWEDGRTSRGAARTPALQRRIRSGLRHSSDARELGSGLVALRVDPR